MNQYMVQDVTLDKYRDVIEHHDMRGPYTADTPAEAASEYGQEVFEEGEDLPASVQVLAVNAETGTARYGSSGPLFIFGVKVHAQPLP